MSPQARDTFSHSSGGNESPHLTWELDYVLFGRGRSPKADPGSTISFCNRETCMPRGLRKGQVVLSELMQSKTLTTRTHNTEALLPELY